MTLEQAPVGIFVAAGVTASDWEDAVRTAGRELVQAEAVGPAYVDEMVRIIQTSGPYCALAPRVAVPHAAAGSLVRKDAFAIVTLTEPVRFGHPHNDPVEVVIGFAAVSPKRHITMLQALANALDQPDTVDALRAATSRADVIEALGLTD